MAAKKSVILLFKFKLKYIFILFVGETEYTWHDKGH